MVAPSFVTGELIARMALFKTVKRKNANPVRQDKAARALGLLFGLVGYWEGVRRDWDPDQRRLREADKAVNAVFELNLAGTHLIGHMDMANEVATRRNFDVWGRDAASCELVRTVFTDGLRQSVALGVASIDTGRAPRIWKLVLEAISWDEGRPCEIRYQVSRVNRNLDMRVDRRLICSGAKYEKVSHIKLTRKR